MIAMKTTAPPLLSSIPGPRQTGTSLVEPDRVEMAEELGCLCPQSWVAHGVHFNDNDIDILLRSGCGICHCPSSNMRLASGIAPIQHYLERGLSIGLGVDGSPNTWDSSCAVGLRDFNAVVGNPQVDRLPLEAAVGWDARQNGNMAELLQEPSLMGALEGAAITVLSKGVLFPRGTGIDPFGSGSATAGS